MEQFLQQLQTIPETAELIRRVEEGGCRRRSADCSRCREPVWGAAVARGTGRRRCLSAATSGRSGSCPEICAP